MTKPTAAQIREIGDLEDLAATINRLLDVLELGHANAARDRDVSLMRAIEREIDVQVARLATVHARRAQIARQLAQKGGD
jgi:hypothetical protein